MNRLAQASFMAALFFVVLSSGCQTLNTLVDPTQPIVYDSSVPAEQTSILSQCTTIKIKKINGKSMFRYSRMIIPAGTHEFVVDYSWDTPVTPVTPAGGKRERHFRNNIAVSYKLIAGHEYFMCAKEDSFKRTVGIVLTDLTEKEAESKREKAQVEEKFKARLPVESSKPTRFEGTWVGASWPVKNTSVTVTGNTWQCVRNNNELGEKGLFIIKGETITFFQLYSWNSQLGEWRPFEDYRNAVFEYRFTFEKDGGLCLTGIKGISYMGGTFFKNQTR